MRQSKASACKIFLALSFLEEVLTNEFDILRVLINERILFLENVTCNNSKGCALKKGFSSVNIIAVASCY